MPFLTAFAFHTVQLWMTISKLCELKFSFRHKKLSNENSLKHGFVYRPLKCFCRQSRVYETLTCSFNYLFLDRCQSNLQMSHLRDLERDWSELTMVSFSLFWFGDVVGVSFVKFSWSSFRIKTEHDRKGVAVSDLFSRRDLLANLHAMSWS